ncbi:hypothetical protein [Tolypothrix sp. FACHB-123]|uniref:hypothetical protein n=1 Tax=Tolypothrix sp. FACHB-123 TaxID=2692868 RepID=UPI001F54FC15|nr:hypothetical protein [Tolypothrix sp. FACHB-123]
MAFKTRGSSAINKAQRRLALLKSIDESLDLGHGLTIENYTRLINDTRAKVEAHNMLVSGLDESRKTLDEMNKALSQFSERMLSGVAIAYGRNSMEYSKAGGSNRQRKKSTSQVPPVVEVIEAPPVPTALILEPTNGKVKS